MVPANKILTVAYGTFSCTLEGFDDPFSTMTDIAEYFRDLAAEDRFFGAEPPTPDMAMLRMIAETRAKRSVDAQPEDGGIVLRPSTVPTPGAMTAAFEAAAEQPEIAPEEESGPAPETAETLETAETPQEAPEPAAAAAAPEIDEVGAEEAAPPAAAETVEAEAPAEEDAAAAEAPAIAEDASEAEAFAEDEEAVAASKEIEDDAATQDELAETEQDEAAMAAKLARIRDVVEADRQADSIYAEDEHADDVMAVADTDLADDTLTAAFAAADLPEETLEESGEDTLAADLSAILAAPAEDEVPAPEAEAEEEDLPAARLAEDPQPEEPAEAAFAFRGIDEAPAEEEVSFDYDESEGGIETDMSPAEDPAAAEIEEEALAVEPRRIRVRKISRDERPLEEEAFAAPQMPDDEPAMPAAEALHASEAVAEADEHADGEDDLMAELAAIEANLVADPLGAAPEAETEIEVEVEVETFDAEIAEDTVEDDLESELAAIRADDAPDGGDALHGDAEVADEADAEEAAEPAEGIDLAAQETAEEAPGAAPPDPDMERLFAATDSRLTGEDASRRHANISHLKAAVAARRADEPSEEEARDETDAYRADLASTVRPRRAERLAEGRSERPGRAERPAPLVLVSEQRVEQEAEAPIAEAAPIQPRRAARLREAELQDEPTMHSGDAGNGDDFEQFAADVGAVDLPDILEAAAVYSAKVMGQDNFSRPRLLHLAAEACDEMSREDGLRGFGQLLRDGTIRKVSRGTFALASDSRYASDAERRVG